MVFSSQTCSLKDRGKMLSVFSHLPPQVISPRPAGILRIQGLEFLEGLHLSCGRRQQETAEDSRSNQGKESAMGWLVVFSPQLSAWQAGLTWWSEATCSLPRRQAGTRGIRSSKQNLQLKTTECNLWKKNKGKKQITKSKRKKEKASTYGKKTKKTARQKEAKEQELSAIGGIESTVGATPTFQLQSFKETVTIWAQVDMEYSNISGYPWQSLKLSEKQRLALGMIHYCAIDGKCLFFRKSALISVIRSHVL